MSTPNRPITNITQGVTGDLPLAPGKSIAGFYIPLLTTNTVPVEIPQGTQVIRVFAEANHAILKFQSSGFRIAATTNDYDEFIPKGHLLDIGMAHNVKGEHATHISINGIAEGRLWIMFK